MWYLHPYAWVNFSRRCDWLKGGWAEGEGFLRKRSRWNIKGGMLINGNRWNGWQPQLVFTEKHQKIQITYLKNCLSTFFPKLAFFLFFCRFWQNTESSWRKYINLNHRLNWNKCSQICKVYLIFYQQLY